MIRYELIPMGIAEISAELNKPFVNLEYKSVIDTDNPHEIIRKIKELSADDAGFSVGEYEINDDGDYINGGDFDTVSNFISRLEK